MIMHYNLICTLFVKYMKHEILQELNYELISLHMCPANKRQRYIVTSSLIGWEHTQNDPCMNSLWNESWASMGLHTQM